ncbi:MAG: two-component system response regulator [Denitrovibrio sp.]|nr:MAG: two-component system response regulator [Denitrovibrio sp.]
MNVKHKVVSIDDNKLNLMLIESMLVNMDVEIVSFISPTKAYEYCLENDTDLILVDYMMPDLDGISFIKKIRTTDKEVPIIMITAIDDDDSIKTKALEAGATEFLNKPLKLYEFQVRVKNILALRRHQVLLKDRAAHLQNEVEKATNQIVDREIETLSILGKASEYKDTETGAHINRVALYAKIIGSELIDDEDMINTLYRSAPLHDIGKIGIPDNILLKPAALTSEEFDVIKTHTCIGYRMLSDAKSKYLQAGAIIANSHHEKWDGSGYPNSLKGDKIPLFGRIVAVCDVFDALISVRPYKKAWSLKDASEYITSQSGTMFDPNIVKIFENKLDEINNIYLKNQDE